MTDENTALIPAALDILKVDVESVKGDVGLKAGQARLKAGLIQVRVDVRERIDRLQNVVTLMRDDMGVNMGRADRAHQTADNTREELRSLSGVVTAMGRQITHLQTQMREMRGDP